MRGRQEEQHGAFAGAEQRFQALHDIAALGEETAMGQHTALGAAGGARGVDDGRRVVRRYAAAALLHGGVRDPGTTGAQIGDRTLVDLPDLLQRGQSVPYGLDDGTVCGVLRDHRDRARITQDPLHLLGRTGLVDRNGDRTGAPDREVQLDPLVAGTGHQGDPVTGLYAGGDQPLGHVVHLGEELGGTHAGPDPRHFAAHDGDIGMLSGVAVDEIRQIAVRRDLVQSRKAELTQDYCSSGRHRCRHDVT